MPYYPTLAEDLARAKEILAKGKAEPFMLGEDLQLPEGGTIYGADLYAAYKLLESFVEVIELMDVRVYQLAMRARDRGRELTAEASALQQVKADLQAATLRASAGECVCRTRGCGHSARQHVGGICQACACDGWR